MAGPGRVPALPTDRRPLGHVSWYDTGREDEPRKGPSAESVEFVRKMRLAAERESAEARAAEWRGRTPDEHGRGLVEVLAVSGAIERSREVPRLKAPLPPGRFPWRSAEADAWRADYPGG